MYTAQELSTEVEAHFVRLQRALDAEAEADRTLRLATQTLKDQKQALVLSMDFDSIKATNAEKREAAVMAECGTLGLTAAVVNAELTLSAARRETERLKSVLDHLKEQRRLLAIEKGLSVQ